MVISLGHLVIFCGNPGNREIPESFRENPDNCSMVGI